MSDLPLSLTPELFTQITTTPSGSVNLPLAIALPICLFILLVVIIVVICLAKRKSWLQNLLTLKRNPIMSRGSVEGSSDLGDNNNDPELGKHQSKGNDNTEEVFTVAKEIEQLTTTASIKPADIATSCEADERKQDGFTGERNFQTYRAVSSYNSGIEDHLYLEPDDIIMVTMEENEQNDWLHGCKHNTAESGWFPKSLVVKVTEVTKLSDSEMSFTSKSASPDDDCITTFECRAVFPFHGSIDHDLTFNAGDTIVVMRMMESGWWYGNCGENFGWFPGSYVERLSDSEPHERTETKNVSEETTHDRTKPSRSADHKDSDNEECNSLESEYSALSSKDEPNCNSEGSTHPEAHKKQELSASNSNGVLQKTSHSSSVIDEDGFHDISHIQVDPQPGSFPGDSGPKKSGKAILIQRLSKLVKIPGLHKLKTMKTTNNSLDLQTLQVPSQSSSSNVSELKKDPTRPRPSKPPPEVPSTSRLASAENIQQLFTTMVSVEKISENPTCINTSTFSDDILSNSVYPSEIKEVKTVPLETDSGNTDTNFKKNDPNDFDLADVITPPPEKFAASCSNNSAQWDDVLGRFDEILSISDVEIIEEESLTDAGMQEMFTANNFDDDYCLDKGRNNMAENFEIINAEHLFDNIKLLPFAPPGFDDLSDKFRDYFRKSVGNVDAERLKSEKSPSLSNKFITSIDEIKRNYPPLAPKPNLPQLKENKLLPSEGNLIKADEIHRNEPVKISIKEDAGLDSSSGNEADDEGKITFVIPEASSYSRSSTILLPDVVRGFIKRDDCEHFLIPPPEDFSNLVIDLEGATTTNSDETGLTHPVEFPDEESIDNNIAQAPRYFTKTLYNSQMEDDRAHHTPSSSVNHTFGSEFAEILPPVEFQTGIVVWKPWVNQSQLAANDSIVVNVGSGEDISDDRYDDSNPGMLFQVEGGSIKFDESDVGIESIV